MPRLNRRDREMRAAFKRVVAGADTEHPADCPDECELIFDDETLAEDADREHD